MLFYIYLTHPKCHIFLFGLSYFMKAHCIDRRLAAAVSKHYQKSEFIDTLYSRYAGLMFAAALEFNVSQADAEDIVSSSMLSLMRKADLLMELEEYRVRAYIVKTVRRTAISFLSRDTLRRRKEKALIGDIVPAGEELRRTDERMTADALLERTLEAIEKLPARQRACVKLKFLLKKTDRRIALDTGLSESSVRKYIGRARKQIRKMLGEEGRV